MSLSGVLAYHEATKHSPESVRRSGRGLDWANQPFPYKEYDPGLPSIDLGPDAGWFGRLLNLGAGVLRKRPVSASQAMYFRTYASAGGLYPVEVYAVAGDVDGIAAGVYHYHPRRRVLVRLRPGDLRGNLVPATGGEPTVATAPLTLALTGVPWRTAWKYGPRGFRHLFWDAGMVVANLLALAASDGLAARVVVGFDDLAVGRLLGVDGRHEFPLCLVTIGGGARGPAAAPAPAPVDVSALDLPSRPLSPEEVDYPQIVAAQESGRLAAGDVAAWRGVDPLRRAAAGPPVVPGPPDRLERAIRRRGSARAFDRTPVPVAALEAILAAATGGIPTDYAPGGSGLVAPDLIANRLDGAAAGAYRYDGGLRLLGAGDFAQEAGYLCLEQWLGHDAAATHFLTIDLDGVLARYGDRGYRAAQLEAGVVGGRMYLAAEAHHLGATGLTFYDDEVAKFFATPGSPPAACMLAMAVGPATRRLLPLAESPGPVRAVEPIKRFAGRAF